MKKKTAILGIGNLLLRDDGIGIHVINELQKHDLAKDIEIIDGGTSIFDLLNVFMENQKVVIVDSLKGGHSPGTIYRVSPSELGNYIQANSSLHDVQIFDIIKNANLLGYYPEVIIIGVEPKEIFYDMELTKELESEIPNIIDIVKDEIKKEIGEISA